jgi:hypothetical protein
MQTRHPCWAIWKGMKQRCDNPNRKDFAYYGGRGIGYDPKWSTLAGFLQDMGERPSLSHTLDRIDVNAGYSKANCRWATRKEQARNQRNNIIVDGRLLVELAEEQNVSLRAMYSRHYRGGKQCGY